MDGAGGSGGAGGAGGSNAVWTCLDTVPAPTYHDGPDVLGGVSLNDILSGDPIVQAAIALCASNDPDCATPLTTSTTDDTGYAPLAWPPDVPSFLEVTATGYPPHIMHRDGAPPPDFNYVAAPISDGTLNQLALLMGGTIDPSRGHMGGQVVDCTGTHAEGVAFEVDTADAGTLVGYFGPNGLPAANRTSTSEDGRIGIGNIPPGPFTVTARVASTGQKICERHGLARAGAMTFMWRFSPEPSP